MDRITASNEGYTERAAKSEGDYKDVLSEHTC